MERLHLDNIMAGAMQSDPVQHHVFELFLLSCGGVFHAESHDPHAPLHRGSGSASIHSLLLSRRLNCSRYSLHRPDDALVVLRYRIRMSGSHFIFLFVSSNRGRVPKARSDTIRPWQLHGQNMAERKLPQCLRRPQTGQHWGRPWCGAMPSLRHAILLHQLRVGSRKLQHWLQSGRFSWCVSSSLAPIPQLGTLDQLLTRVLSCIHQ